MQEKGVGSRSLAKARASTVIGQPPGVGLGGKIWNKSEFDAAVAAGQMTPDGECIEEDEEDEDEDEDEDDA